AVEIIESSKKLGKRDEGRQQRAERRWRWRQFPRLATTIDPGFEKIDLSLRPGPRVFRHYMDAGQQAPSSVGLIGIQLQTEPDVIRVSFHLLVVPEVHKEHHLDAVPLGK